MNKRSFRFKFVAGIAVAAFAAFYVWPEEEEQKNTPYQLVALDKTPLVERLLMKRTGNLSAVEAPLRLDPYDSSLLKIKRRTHRDPPGRNQFTFLVPPSLIYKFSLRQEEGVSNPTTSALSVRISLPDYSQRTEVNHDQFEADLGDFLEITVASNQALGLPDSWQRQFISCDETQTRIPSEFNGLSMKDSPGTGILIGCEPVDELPNKVPPLLWCLGDTRGLKSCEFLFVLPWRLFAENDDKGNTLWGHRSGDGVVIRVKYPATYLSQWRYLRDVSFCLVEAMIPELSEIHTPSRNSRLCEQIGQSLISGEAKLLSDPEKG